MFVDIATITLKAGDGGDGAVSFHTEKYVPAGGPDGGDGGKGGDIIFIADTNVSTLLDFKYKRKYIADNGMKGGSKNCSGKGANDLIIRVPKGTLIKDAESGKIIADMSSDEKKIVVYGGKGGKGNANFATPTRQIPRFSKPGFKGQIGDVLLELKLLADVGIIGFPNVGKSTLISVTSAAKPKIANYHFTTITPVLGVVDVGDGKSFTMADIPGLIEGASDGVGLGHYFLRHIERCRLIIHMVDISEIEGRDSIDDYDKINIELEKFNKDLSLVKQIVVGNKSDMAGEEQIERFKSYIEDKGHEIYFISAVTHNGVKELMSKVCQAVGELPPIKMYESEYTIQDKKDTMDFSIEVVEGVYYIEAPFMQDIMRTINMDDYESLHYFQRVLRNSGIIAELDKMGVKEEDTINILGYQFDYIN